RKFSQTYDLIVNLRGLDLKKQEDKVDFFFQLPKPKGKPQKICALIGPELLEEAKNCDFAITQKDFPLYKQDKKKVKKLAEQHDFFIGQANIMPEIAAVFGGVLGPRGKMPNPKAGCIVPPKVALKPLVEKLKNTIRIQTKNETALKCPIGNEKMPDEEVAENLVAVYNQIVSHLPQEENNIRNAYLKLTMSKPVKLK
ncbi:MAG: 50S ribosomal protein L1, partial [Candidatus Woesearchaeota archaeon]